MNIKIGVDIRSSNKGFKMCKDNIILTYNTTKFDKHEFETKLLNASGVVKNRIKTVREDDTLIVAADLMYRYKTYLGGCAIGGSTINATRVGIVEMAAKQLSRQIENTIKHIKNKRGTKR